MQKPRRRSVRLPDYDYSSSGAYFITLVTWKRESIFGKIVAGEMQLNQFGDILREEWQNTAAIRPEIDLDTYQIMPNHIHAVLVIRDVGSQSGGSAPGMDDPTHVVAPLPRPILERKPRTLGACIAGIKSITTKRINQARNVPGVPVWQRNYYEHGIRDEGELQRIRAYIQSNPEQWQLDDENPSKVK